MDDGASDHQRRTLTEPLLTPDFAGDNAERGDPPALTEGCADESDLESDRSDDDGRRRRRRPRTSKNVGLTLAYTGVSFAGRAVWSLSVLPTFVFLLCGDNPEYVGFLTAITGACQLLSSFPSGAYADAHRRDALLKAASVVGIGAAALTSIATMRRSLSLLGVSLAVWGLFWGMAETSVSALFADSVRDGDRARVFTKRYVTVKGGTLAGPAVAAAMFAVLGNSWTVEDCAVVVVAGQAVMVPACMLLCWFDDDEAVHHHGHHVEEGENEGGDGGGGPSRESGEGSHRSTQPASEGPSLDRSDVESGTPDDGAEGRREGDKKFCLCIPPDRLIPICVAAADFSAGLAAGMSVRYFPIFYMDNLKLSPIAVQGMYAIGTIGQALLSKMAHRLSMRIGRPQTTVAFKWTGVALMVTMVSGYKAGFPLPLVCVLAVVRDSFMNSTQALNRSLLMDSVPRGERGKWSALESVNMFSWSGSAAIGGILVGLRGVLFNFYITAAMQFLATLPLVALFMSVGIEGDVDSTGEGGHEGHGEEAQRAEAVGEEVTENAGYKAPGVEGEEEEKCLGEAP